MKRIVLAVTGLVLCTHTYSKEEANSNAPVLRSIAGSKLILKYQAFASHDKNGTDIDTVRHAGDYIIFAHDGKAYLNFNGQKDTAEYIFTGSNAVSFGDTPFIIKSMGNNIYTLYQNEEEANGDYNRVTYFLKKE